ncbi:hypothetical protein ANN_18476 [Periplaneta americana]|uniref:Uncharacterized protein n=1 Tax=Periplaneta americana TaxID=6978 RepID=A0ABQ8SQ78_PERAM|nr:hypothetical protein ANN_18476 [Periplaneta americana]
MGGETIKSWLLNDAVSTTRLLSVDEIGDSEMVFGEMRLRIRHRLPGIHLMIGENLGKNPTSIDYQLKMADPFKRFGEANISEIEFQRLRWAGHVARMDESRNAYRVLVGRPEGKRPLGRPRRRWDDNIKMDLREMGYDDRKWINLAQDRNQWRAYVRAAMNLRVP